MTGMAKIERSEWGFDVNLASKTNDATETVDVTASLVIRHEGCPVEHTSVESAVECAWVRSAK